MKQRDIAVIIAVAIVAGLASFGVSQLLFGGDKQYKLTAPLVEPISADFKNPSATYFNNRSINLTVNIKIGDGGNDTFLKKQNAQQ